jgi:hypothetical protein
MRLIVLIIFFLPVLVYGSESEVKGLLETRTFVDSYSASSIMDMVGDEQAMVDARILARIMVKADAAENTFLFVAYENSFSKGEYMSAIEALEGRTGYMDVIEERTPKDNTQLFTLSQEYVDNNGETAYHRLDRLYLKYILRQGEIRFGRQAVFWGHGQIFQTADFINPYSPTDTLAQYKEGQDLLSIRVRGRLFSDEQLIIVPGRDPEDREIDYDHSSALFRLNRYTDGNRFAVYGGTHNGDETAGLGGRVTFNHGGFGGDVVAGNGSEETYITAVVNVDYSWLTLGDDTTGFAELYYNSLGEASIDDARNNPDLYRKIQTGEINLRDEYYTAIGIEYTPVRAIDLYTQAVVNLRDMSYILQPKIEYHHREDLVFTVGLDLPFGSTGTEFGGFYDDATGRLISAPKRVYGQVALYF